MTGATIVLRAGGPGCLQPEAWKRHRSHPQSLSPIQHAAPNPPRHLTAAALAVILASTRTCRRGR